MLNFFRVHSASQLRVCNRCSVIHNKARSLKLHGRKTVKTAQQFYSTNDRGGGGIVIPNRGQIGTSSSTRAPLELSTGKLARLADGSAVAKLGNTSVMTTAVCTGKSSSLGFFPLTVDYRQKAAAAGRIPTNFLRREMGVTEREILTGRMIDRSIRPLFPKNFNQETGISCNLLSVDGVYDPEVLSVNGASAALAVSGIPWGPVVGAARVALCEKRKIIVNPTRKELQGSQLNMVVAGTAGGLATMIESESKCLEPERFVECVAAGLEYCASVAENIEILSKTQGKTKRSLEKNTQVNKEMLQFMAAMAEGRLRVIYTDYSLDKQLRDSAMFAVRDDVVSKIRVSRPDWDPSQINEAFTTVSRDLVRSLIFDDGIRVDGRGLEQIRPISCEVDLHNPLHGSALFQRGQTQVFCTVALDSLHSAMKLDPISVITGGVKEKNFMLHYEFPGYATGELSRGGFNRREMGHGALAEKALKQVVPEDREFAMRLTSEVLESNGSSSMASICGGSLALLDAGIPLSESASGVAMGLVTRDGQHKVLTDIMGMEDFLGDMDFKLSSTRSGVTALQADVKIPGISLDIIKEAVEKGVDANQRILDIMDDCLKVPRKSKSCWPVSQKLEVPSYKRGKFLGTAGINLRRITSETGVQVNSEEEGVWTLFAPSPQAMAEAKVMIDRYLEEEKIPELIFGSIYTAKILEILEKGVMIQLHTGIDPVLLHNSQLSNNKVGNATALGFEVGQDLQVKYYGRDPVTGNIRISRKVLTVSSAQAAKDLRRSARSSVVKNEDGLEDTSEIASSGVGDKLTSTYVSLNLPSIIQTGSPSDLRRNALRKENRLAKKSEVIHPVASLPKPSSTSTDFSKLSVISDKPMRMDANEAIETESNGLEDTSEIASSGVGDKLTSTYVSPLIRNKPKEEVKEDLIKLLNNSPIDNEQIKDDKVEKNANDGVSKEFTIGAIINCKVEIEQFSKLIQEAKKDAKFHYQQWRNANKPRHGDLFQNMRRSDYQFRNYVQIYVKISESSVKSLKGGILFEASEYDLFKKDRKMGGKLQELFTEVKPKELFTEVNEIGMDREDVSQEIVHSDILNSKSVDDHVMKDLNEEEVDMKILKDFKVEKIKIDEVNVKYYEIDRIVNTLMNINIEINETKLRKTESLEKLEKVKTKITFLSDTSAANPLLADVFIKDTVDKYKRTLDQSKAIEAVSSDMLNDVTDENISSDINSNRTEVSISETIVNNTPEKRLPMESNQFANGIKTETLSILEETDTDIDLKSRNFNPMKLLDRDSCSFGDLFSPVNEETDGDGPEQKGAILNNEIQKIIKNEKQYTHNLLPTRRQSIYNRNGGELEEKSFDPKKLLAKVTDNSPEEQGSIVNGADMPIITEKKKKGGKLRGSHPFPTRRHSIDVKEGDMRALNDFYTNLSCPLGWQTPKVQQYILGSVSQFAELLNWLTELEASRNWDSRTINDVNYGLGEIHQQVFSNIRVIQEMFNHQQYTRSCVELISNNLNKPDHYLVKIAQFHLDNTDSKYQAAIEKLSKEVGFSEVLEKKRKDVWAETRAARKELNGIFNRLWEVELNEERLADLDDWREEKMEWTCDSLEVINNKVDLLQSKINGLSRNRLENDWKSVEVDLKDLQMLKVSSLLMWISELPNNRRPEWLTSDLAEYLKERCRRYHALDQMRLEMRKSWMVFGGKGKDDQNQTDLSLDVLYSSIRSGLAKVKYSYLENRRHEQEIMMYEDWKKIYYKDLRKISENQLDELMEKGRKLLDDTEEGLKIFIEVLGDGDAKQARKASKILDQIRDEKRSAFKEIGLVFKDLTNPQISPNFYQSDLLKV